VEKTQKWREDFRQTDMGKRKNEDNFERDRCLCRGRTTERSIKCLIKSWVGHPRNRRQFQGIDTRATWNQHRRFNDNCGKSHGDVSSGSLLPGDNKQETLAANYRSAGDGDFRRGAGSKGVFKGIRYDMIE